MNYQSHLKEHQIISTSTKGKLVEWEIIAVLRDGKVLAKSIIGDVQKVFERNYAFGI